MDEKKFAVLIVDDQPELREILRDLIERRSCECFEAQNGKVGFEMAGARAFDLILTDIQMPEMDGLQMLEALRAAGNLTPVLVISGLRDARNIRRAWNLGVFDFVDKPFDSKQLLSLIRNAIEFGKTQAQQWANTQVFKKRVS